MVVTTGSNTIELISGGMVYSEKEDIFKDWSELSPEVQARLDQILKDIGALVEEGVGLIQQMEDDGD